MTDHFVAQHQKNFERGGPAWLEQLRQKGLKSFQQLGYPNNRQEDWKYTSVKPLTEIPFQLGGKNQPGAHHYDRLSCLHFGPVRLWRIAFINGYFAPDHSNLTNLPRGVEVLSLQEAIQKYPERLKEELEKPGSTEKKPFLALNTAFLSDGAFIHLEKNVVLENPIELFFISLSDPSPVVSHPRNLIIAEEGSQATIIENYSGKKSDHPYFTNTVTKITAGTGAVLNHYKLQDEVETAFHLSSLEVEQKRDSSFSSYNLSLGALLARHEIQSNLLAEGADCLLNGLYMGHGRQHVDNQTYIDHIKPHCTSRELYKGILDDKAHGVFNGQILVRHGAQKTQSSLTNNNLLLSQEALIDTKPLLEIFADDVKCSHAATIGRLAEDQVFYCRSRGIDKELSRHLLTYAFASEILHGIKIQTLKTELEKIILNRLRIGELSVEATP